MVVTYNTAMDPSQYMAISLKAARYYLEKAAFVDLPLIETKVKYSKKYRWTRLGKPYIAAEDTVANVATGGLEAEEWEDDPDLADVQHGYQDYDLASIKMAIKVQHANIPQFMGPNLLADKREAMILKFALDVDEGLIRGIYDRTGKVLLASGYQAQAAGVTNLNGVDSKLDAKGDIWKGIVKMMETIPLAMRQEGPPMILVMSEHVLKKATDPERVYLQDIEWDYIKKYLMGERAEEARKIGQVRVSDKLLLAGTDTIVTNDRMALFVPDKRWLGRCISRGFSKIGEKRQMTNTIIQYGWTGRCIVDNNLAATFSDQITW